MKLTDKQKMLLYVCGIVVIFMVLYANLFLTGDDYTNIKTVDNQNINIYNE